MEISQTNTDGYRSTMKYEFVACEMADSEAD